MQSLPAENLTDNIQPILIQGAMDVETQQLIQALSNPKHHSVAAWSFWQGKIDGYPVVISRTEIGLAHAAASTTLAIERFKPKWIINQGTAGGHDPKLMRGDIVVASSCFNMGAIKTSLTPKGGGMHPQSWHQLGYPMHLRENNQIIEHTHFPSDPHLYNTALSTPNRYSHGKVISGIIGSADEWNRELDRINWYHETYHTAAEEMESSAVALVAKGYGIPFLSIRVLSNTDQHGQEFEPQTAVDCQHFTLDVVKALIGANRPA